MTDETRIAALRAEALKLADALRAEVPKHARTWRAVQLEAGAPAAIAALWESVGFSAALEKRGMIPPELPLSEKRIAERLADYTSWGEGFSLTSADLPAKRRLVQDDGQGVAFFVTDESSGQDDAPVLGVFADTNKIKKVADSYVAWCGNELTSEAFGRWYQTDISLDPTTALTKLGTACWPLITKAARELAPDVVCMPTRDSTSSSLHKKGSYRLAHRSVQALVSFLETLEVTSIDMRRPPGDRVDVPKPIDTLLKEGDTIRWLPSPTQARLGVAQLGNEPVVVRADETSVVLWVSPRNTDELKATLATRTGG